jgi:hypothetical protein
MDFSGLSTAEGRANERFDRVAEKLVLRPFDFAADAAKFILSPVEGLRANG